MERGEEGGNFSRIFSTFGHEETISIAYVNHDTTPFRRILLQTIEKLIFLYHLSNLIPLLPFLFPRNNRKLDIYFPRTHTQDLSINRYRSANSRINPVFPSPDISISICILCAQGEEGKLGRSTFAQFGNAVSIEKVETIG